MRAEEYAAASLKVDGGHDPKDSSQADPALWSKYYPVDKVNQAPFIFLCGQAKDPINCGFGVTFTEVPLQVDAPAEILASDPKPLLQWRPTEMALKGELMPLGGDNKAPEFFLNENADPYGDDEVGVAMVDQPLNLPAAEYILRKYRG